MSGQPSATETRSWILVTPYGGRKADPRQGRHAVLGGARSVPRMTEPWKVRTATVIHAATRPA